MEYSLFTAIVKDSLATNDGEIYLGVNNIFDRPPREVLPVKEGFAGTQSQFACIVCKLGYCSVDRASGKIFIYNEGSPPREISAEGMFHFWKTNAQHVAPTTDNPFTGRGYYMVYDDFNNRLIVTKRDLTVDNETRLDVTMSFSGDIGERGAWVCLHDYAPQFMFSNREGVYIIDNGASAKLYRHNSQTNKATFLGTVYKSYIDVPFNEGKDITKTFSCAKWLTEVVNSSGVKLENKTITHLMVYNNDQCSGLLDLQADGGLWFGKDARNNEETWQFNNFRDMIGNKANPFLDSNNAVISGNINLTKSWFKRHKFLSKFVIVRFQYSNVDQNDLYIIAVGVNARPSTR
jgi:hypothetical protein